MKYLITTMFLFCFLNNISSQNSENKELDSLKNEIEILNTKIQLEIKKQEYYNVIKIIDTTSSVGLGITFGVGYFTGSLDRPLIGSAEIDEAGVVRILEERRTITRLFPTITGYALPLRKFKKIQPLDKLMLGGTVGVNEGATNDGNGFALAIGLSLGFKINKVGHFGVFRGFIYDPTVTELPLGFIDGQRAPEGYSANSLIKTKTRNARYGSWGVVFSISL